MDSEQPQVEIDYEFLPLIRVYKNGRVERLLGTESIPAGPDPKTGVLSKDVHNIISETEVYVRIYLPSNLKNGSQKLPLLVYFHGGGFCLSTPSSPNYHNYLNAIVSEAQIIAVSVHYRRAPEHRLPVAYEDSWAALHWIVSHRNGDGPEPWLNNHSDFGRLFMAGDSSGANIAHNLAMAIGKPDLGFELDVIGIALIHPYFWGSVPIGSESIDPDRKATVDRLWPFVCPNRADQDDPWVNPVAEDAPSLEGLGCKRVIVCVAEKDILKDRGWVYYQVLGRSGWTGVVEIHQTDGEDHAFHLYTLESEKAKNLIRKLADFFNRDMPPWLR
ncbi:hypothetical protein M9H77_25016 [Catharanthus roseus]|uniref:Uncharacterized protein n=1 Tax=Catharanthus roseus TaxID=4058 RepID=A0ACC0A893_CATRO|nr:hypothetical protein M9H77_25016 [Catharanthus roseus]